MRRALPRRLGGLGARLVILMGLALLPLAVLTYVQTLEANSVSRKRAETAILGETLMAGASLSEQIMRAQGAAQGLAAAMGGIDPATPEAEAECRATLERFVSANQALFSFAGYVEANGQMRCTSNGESMNFGETETLRAMMEDPRPVLRLNRRGVMSKTTVLLLVNPVMDGAGRVTGFLSLSIPHSILRRETDGDLGAEGKPLALFTFSNEDELLTSSIGVDQAPGRLPRGFSIEPWLGNRGDSFLARTAEGEMRAFAVVPLVPRQIYLVGSWPEEQLGLSFLNADLPASLFPALMWGASLLVAWLAAEAQVLRHVRALRASITAFAGGDRKVKPLAFGAAARELREVGAAYEKMTLSILHDEAELEDIIHQKEVLLREVHHRVKNNLQLIASIINMQLRSVKSPEAREAMRSVQERVLSLATIHRELYQTSGLTDVRADELLPQIVRHILKIAETPRRRFVVETAIDEIRLPPDQAVPLALFLTEGLANVIKHSHAGAGARARVDLRLGHCPTAGEARLELVNDIGSGAPAPSAMTSDGFGTQLLTAFARQLEGRVERGLTEAGRYRLAVVFPLRALDEAEARRAPAEPPEGAPEAGEEDPA